MVQALFLLPAILVAVALAETLHTPKPNDFFWSPDYPHEVSSTAAQVYVESSISVRLSYQQLKSLTSDQSLHVQSSELDPESCKAFESAFDLGETPTYYIFEGFGPEPLKVFKCEDHPFLKIIRINLEEFQDHPEAGDVLQNASGARLGEKMRVYVGSICGIENLAAMIGVRCLRSMDSTTNSNEYSRLKNLYGAESAVILYGLTADLDASLIQTMFNDIKAYLDAEQITADSFEIANNGIVRLLDPVHEGYITDDLVEQLYGYTWSDFSKIQSLPTTNALKTVLDQSAHYLKHYKYSDNSFTTVNAKLALLFAYYTSNLVPDLEAFTVSTNTGVDPDIKVAKWKFFGNTVTAFSLNLDDFIFTVADNGGVFSQNQIGSAMYIKFSSTSFNIHFGISMFNAGSYNAQTLDLQQETAITSSSNKMTVNLQIKSIDYAFSTLSCAGDSCFVVTSDSTSVTLGLYLTSSLKFSIIKKSCEEFTALYKEYDTLASLYGVQLALVGYTSHENLVTCFISRMWADLKAFIKVELPTQDTFEVFNYHVTALMNKQNFGQLTEALMKEMLGYSFLSETYVPNTISAATIQNILDQACLYISFLQRSDESLSLVDSVLKNFFRLYSNRYQSLAAQGFEGQCNADLITLNVYKDQVEAKSLLAYTFNSGKSTVTFEGTSPFGVNDVVSVFYMNYVVANAISDYFSFHLYNAGTYDGSVLTIKPEEEVLLTAGTFTLNAKLDHSPSSPGFTFNCKDTASCTTDYSNSILIIKAKVQGFHSTILDCMTGYKKSADGLSCLLICDDVNCKICSPTKDICTECITGKYLNSKAACLDCEDFNCLTCQDSTKCKDCISPYVMGSQNKCVKCEDTNCKVCSTDNKCAECKTSSFAIDTDFQCKSCVKPCVTCNGLTTSACLSCGDLNKDFQSGSQGECICVDHSSRASDNFNCVCDDGYVKDAATKSCIPCTSHCKTCVDSPAKCISCGDRTVFGSNQCSCKQNAEFKGDSDIDCTCKATFGLATDLLSCGKCLAPCLNCISLSTDSCSLCGNLNNPIGSGAQKNCECVSNSQRDANGIDCVCNDGYYQIGSGNTASCSKCTDHCKTCSLTSSSCQTCGVLATQSSSKCSCRDNAQFIDSASEDCKCNDGYFVSGSGDSATCNACTNHCKTCITSASTCQTCGTLAKLAINACSCEDNAAFASDSSSDCKCNDGYLISVSGNTASCTPCTSHCKTCITNASTCQTCGILAELTLNTCACKANSAFTGDSSVDCICNDGYVMSGSGDTATCIPCTKPCKTCKTTPESCQSCGVLSTLTDTHCSCVANSIITAGGIDCKCSLNYVANSQNTACNACLDPCVTCDLNNLSKCFTCGDLNNFDASAGTCSCKSDSTRSSNLIDCLCNDGYVKIGTGDAATCTACSSHCKTCITSPSTCQTCGILATQTSNACVCRANAAFIGDSSVDCKCDDGYVISGSGDTAICNACTNHCKTCITSASTCQTCGFLATQSSNVCSCKANAAFISDSSLDCKCIDGYIINGSGDTASCIACTSHCKTCITSSSTCQTCGILATQSSNACVCRAFAAFASDSSVDCKCNDGYVISGSGDTASCIACTSHCKTCSTSPSSCQTCGILTTKISDTCACKANAAFIGDSSADCKCDDGYVISGSGDTASCIPCTSHCKTCITSASTCQTCGILATQSSNACVCRANAAFISDSSLDCKCKDGYIVSVSGNTASCIACTSHCQTCITSADTCQTCGTLATKTSSACVCRANSAFIDNLSADCKCNEGYFINGSGDTASCIPCTNHCKTCSSSSFSCDSCGELAVYNSHNCQCIEHAEFVSPFSINCQCLPKFVYSSDSKTCNCIPGYKLNSTNECTLCQDSNCKRCSGSNICIECISSAFIINSSFQCQSCNSPCAQCATNANFCTQCGDLSELNSASGKCSCVSGAGYSSNNIDCQCLPGYQSTVIDGRKQCVPCRKYIKQSDITSAYYENDFKSLIFNFNSKISKVEMCSSLVGSDFIDYLGVGAVCQSINQTQVQVKLGENWKGLKGLVLLSSLLEYADDRVCTIAVPTLTANVTHNSTISTPSAKLVSSMSEISIQCSADVSPHISASSSVDPVGNSLKYAWAFYNLSSFENFTTTANYFASIAESDFFMQIGLLSNYVGDILVQVTVINAFNETATSNLTLSFVNRPLPTVEIQGGSVQYIYNKVPLVFKAFVSEVCNLVGTPTFTWILAETSDTNPKFKINSVQSDNQLIFSKNMLRTNAYYNFTVKATINSITASTFLELHVLEEILIAVLDVPQAIRPNISFLVSANRTYNPNEESLTFRWNCSSNTGSCPSALNSVLSSAKNSTVQIPSLIYGDINKLTITVNASTANSFSIASGTLSISSDTSLLMYIYPPASRVALYKDFIINSNITILNSTASSNASFVWTISDKVKIDSRGYPFIYVSSGKLNVPGKLYLFTLTSKVGKVTYTGIYNITTNVPPVCHFVNVNKVMGNAFSTVFKFNSFCDDGDYLDYPLYSRVGFIQDGISADLSAASDPKAPSSLFPKGTVKAYFASCDTLDDCSFTYFTLSLSLNSNLNYTEKYFSLKAEDNDSILASITILTNTYTLSTEFIQQLLNDLKEYNSNLKARSLAMMNTVLTSSLNLINPTQRPNLNYTIVEGVFSLTSQMLDDYNLLFQYETMQMYMTISYFILSQNSSNSANLGLAQNLTVKAFNFYFNSKLPGSNATFENSLFSAHKASGIDYNSNIGKAIEIGGVGVEFPDLGLSQENSQITLSVTKFVNVSKLSDMIEFTIESPGFIENFNYIKTDGSISQFPNPVKLTFGIYDSRITSSYSCGYLNSKNTFSTDGCSIVSVNHTNHKATIGISHTTLFTILNEQGCDDNYVPLYIMAVVLFIELFCLPYALIFDNISSEKIKKEESDEQNGLSGTIHNSPDSPASPTEKPMTSLSISMPDVEELSESIVDNGNADFTIEFALKPIDTDEHKTVAHPKNKFELLIEGHLLFGLFIFRTKFSRTLRILTLFTILLLQLLLEGLFYYGAYSYEDGRSKSTQTLFDDYEANYFGFSILSIAISIPVEILLIILFSQDRQKTLVWTIFGLLLVVITTAGSIIGIFILTFKFCFQWSGYWAISFLWSILIEIFFLQFVYMFIRYPLREKA